jgi:mycothiol maleylpyruvate isomerase-like protein
MAKIEQLPIALEIIKNGALIELEHISDLVRMLSPNDWSRPSAVAGWTIGDIVVHLDLFFFHPFDAGSAWFEPAVHVYTTACRAPLEPTLAFFKEQSQRPDFRGIVAVPDDREAIGPRSRYSL